MRQPVDVLKEITAAIDAVREAQLKMITGAQADDDDRSAGYYESYFDAIMDLLDAAPYVHP